MRELRTLAVMSLVAGLIWLPAPASAVEPVAPAPTVTGNSILQDPTAEVIPLAGSVPLRAATCAEVDAHLVVLLPAGACATSQAKNAAAAAYCTAETWVAYVHHAFSLYTATVASFVNCSNNEYLVAACGVAGRASVGAPPAYLGTQLGLGPFCGVASTPFGFYNAVNIDGSGAAIINGQVYTWGYSGRVDP